MRRALLGLLACAGVACAVPALPAQGKDKVCLPGQGGGSDYCAASSNRRVFSGTSRADRITGTRKGDVIIGGAGNDVLHGRGGHDDIDGGLGTDKVYGDAGADALTGGPGNDTLTGGSGKDLINGDSGGDLIRARDKTKDRIICGSGKDTVVADKKDTVSNDCERVSRR